MARVSLIDATNAPDHLKEDIEANYDANDIGDEHGHHHSDYQNFWQGSVCRSYCW